MVPPPTNDPVTAATESSFRTVMSHVPTAVSVVTTLVNDEPHGTTVSSFMSLSVRPPMVLVSLGQGSTLLSKLHLGSVLGINVLSEPQEKLASHFAQKRPDKFGDLDWEIVDDAPRLPGSHAWISITVTERIGAADHTLVLGAVITQASSASNAPLTYWRHTYGTHTTS